MCVLNSSLSCCHVLLYNYVHIAIHILVYMADCFMRWEVTRCRNGRRKNMHHLSVSKDGPPPPPIPQLYTHNRGGAGSCVMVRLRGRVRL